MSKIRGFDAHEAAPSSIKNLFKFYQKLPLDQLEVDPRIVHLRRGLNCEQTGTVHVAGIIPKHSLHAAYDHLSKERTAELTICPADVEVYAVDNLPGELSYQYWYSWL